MSQQPVQTPEQLDAEQNKVMAILAYFIFFLPLLAAPNSKFARYHANQGLILLLFYVGVGIVNAILNGILGLIGLGIISLLLGFVFSLVYIGLMVLGILGIVNAAQSKMQPMPLIGKLFALIK